MKLWRKTIDIRGQRWGIERSTLIVAGEKYMDRYILYVAGFTARLHKFWRGDDDRAPHDHPWNFWTFPLVTYEEKLPIEQSEGWYEYRQVKAFRFHYRAAEFQHIVCGRRPIFEGDDDVLGREDARPFWTLVFTGRRKRLWGFWPDEHTFIDYRKW